MGFNCGIVGLPNVGKSTLFNALTATAAAEAANYPFCTVEPNVGRVSVPDPRLTHLAKIAESKTIIPTQLEFVDIAGLVRGASKGDGLGNQFLANIRDTDAIIHVLRCFEGEVTHVDGSVDPVRDAQTVTTELILADLESAERRLSNAQKRSKSGSKEDKALVVLLEEVVAALSEEKPARSLCPDPSDEDGYKLFKMQQFLTAKPVLYVCNVGEEEASTGNAYSEAVTKMAKAEGNDAVMISAAIEAEISQLEDPEEKAMFLEEVGLQETGLSRLIHAGYGLLGLITFFTIGPKEARAWTVRNGAKAPEAAGQIHTDFERGFIRAQTIAYEDYLAYNGENGAKEAGKFRSEGKEYLVLDGDVFHFLSNV